MKMKTFKLSKENFESLIKIIYNSFDAQSFHNTQGFDRFSGDSLKRKLGEMIVCNEHEPCKILTQLLRDDKNG